MPERKEDEKDPIQVTDSDIEEQDDVETERGAPGRIAFPSKVVEEDESDE